MKRSGCGVIRSIESDAPVTMVHPSAPCTTQSHSTLHLVTSRWSWVLGSSGAAAAFGVRMMRASKESPSVARAVQIRCALMRRVACMACAKHLLLPCIPLVPGCDGRLGVLAPKAAEAPHGIQETTPAQGSHPGSWYGQLDAAFTQEWPRDAVPAPLGRPHPCIRRHRGRRRCWEGPLPSVVTYAEGLAQPTPAVGWSAQPP